MQAARKGVLNEKQLYTYEDYCTWGDSERWELIEGRPYAMAPAPSYPHQSISGKIFYQLAKFLHGKTCEVISAPFDVRLKTKGKKDTVVQPDLLVICDKLLIDEKGCNGAPDMIVEILSPSSVTHDMLIKYGLYLKAGVREYWIVDPGAKTIITHVLKDGAYERKIYDYPDTAQTTILEGCNVELSEVFEQ